MLNPLDSSCNVEIPNCSKFTGSNGGGENSSLINPYIQLGTGKVFTAVTFRVSNTLSLEV